MMGKAKETDNLERPERNADFQSCSVVDSSVFPVRGKPSSGERGSVSASVLLPDSGSAIHILGICGAGCFPLAMLLNGMGYRVSGSDLAMPSEEQQRDFDRYGVEFHSGHREENLPEKLDLLVYTSAAGADNPELNGARRRGVKCLRRGEMLAAAAGKFRRVAAVSGSHGKSSISGMLSYLLEKKKFAASRVIGAKLSGGFSPWHLGDGDILVIESDESDGTNAELENIFLGIVPNLEDDHVWSLGGVEKLKENFHKFASRSEKLLYWSGTMTDEVFAGFDNAFSLNGRSDLADLAAEHRRYGFEAENFITVLSAGEIFGIPAVEAADLLMDFPGVERRMSIRGERENGRILLLEDYAHHPTELENALLYLKKRFPEQYLSVVFQPHRYARLKRYFKEYARILGNYPDQVTLVDVFAAWSEKGELGSAELAEAAGERADYFGGSFPELAEQLYRDAEKMAGEGKKVLIAVIGAGDVNQLTRELEKYF